MEAYFVHFPGQASRARLLFVPLAGRGVRGETIGGIPCVPVFFPHDVQLKEKKLPRAVCLKDEYRDFSRWLISVVLSYRSS